MHSFEVNIRICQPENSDVHRDEAEVNIPFEGWLILMFIEKECTNCFVIYDTVSLFLVLFKVVSYLWIISSHQEDYFNNTYEICKIIAF